MPSTITTEPAAPHVGGVYWHPRTERFVIVLDEPEALTNGLVVVGYVEAVGVPPLAGGDLPSDEWASLRPATRDELHDLDGERERLVDELVNGDRLDDAVYLVRLSVRSLAARVATLEAANPGVDPGEMLGAITLLRVNQKGILARLEALEEGGR
jgi:hypothetical protein